YPPPLLSFPTRRSSDLTPRPRPRDPAAKRGWAFVRRPAAVAVADHGHHEPSVAPAFGRAHRRAGPQDGQAGARLDDPDRGRVRTDDANGYPQPGARPAHRGPDDHDARGQHRPGPVRARAGPHDGPGFAAGVHPRAGRRPGGRPPAARVIATQALLNTISLPFSSPT